MLRRVSPRERHHPSHSVRASASRRLRVAELEPLEHRINVISRLKREAFLGAARERIPNASIDLRDPFAPGDLQLPSEVERLPTAATLPVRIICVLLRDVQFGVVNRLAPPLVLALFQVFSLMRFASLTSRRSSTVRLSTQTSRS
jgi:hypothetical protein